MLFGGVMLLIGGIILGAWFGLVPTDGGQFLAPPLVIISLGFCFVLGGLTLWIPARAPVFLRTTFFFLSLVLLTILFNWTAFAPGVRYASSTTFGPLTIGGSGNIGGRIAFGLAALVVDALLVFSIVSWVRSAGRGDG
jgi:hypothetical protein